MLEKSSPSSENGHNIWEVVTAFERSLPCWKDSHRVREIVAALGRLSPNSEIVVTFGRTPTSSGDRRRVQTT